MRQFNYIQLLSITLTSILLLGCTKSEMGSMDYEKGDKALITIDVKSGGAVSRADNISERNEDYSIESLRVLAIDEKGLVEVNKFTDEIKATNNGVYYSFEVVKAPKKLLYVVVNEPSVLTAKLDAIRLQSELKTLNYEIAEAENNRLFISGKSLLPTNTLIPMGKVQEIDATGDGNIVVRVDRVLARVDLMVDKDELAYASEVEFNSSTSVSVTGLYYNTSFFEPNMLPTPTSAGLVKIDNVSLSKTTAVELESADRSSANRLLSFYVAERTYNIDQDQPSENRIAINIDNISVDGELQSINSTILLGNNVQPYLEEINRNYIYRIYATYHGKEQSLEVSGEYVIKDWIVEELDGDIEGVMLSVSNQVVMDWTRLDDSFTADDVAFGSNRSIDFYVPTSYDEATAKHEFKKCNIAASKGAKYDLLNLSQYGVTNDENFLRDIPWLTRAAIVFDSDRTGHFEFTYKLGATPYYLDSVPLQLVSANVRKQIEVIYDNGYVPGDLLQANDKVGCWGSAPNGIIFTKRGDAVHPLVNESVLTVNSDGLYDGDITMSADAADQYCKEKLGSKWYAPNKAQLADIQSHVLELGTSYRYNNGAGTLYWSSESDGANYWSINFEKGVVAPSPVSAPASTLNHVRCIANI